MITYIFRKRTALTFSIEKLFDALFAHFARSDAGLRRLELPHVSTGLVSVARNVWFVARRQARGILHITGDVHYAALLCPFSKTIVTIHDCIALKRRTGLARWVMRALWFTLPLRMATAVTVISEQTRRELLDHVALPAGKVRVIPNFVDPAFEFNYRAFSGEQPRILHVGTTPNKNLSRVVAALRGIPCVLVIVGVLPPSLLSELHESTIVFENVVGLDAAEMTRAYHDADIVSFPSTYEGFGMPILEGQAVGRPVLTSALEPMRSVAGGGGALLVDPRSIEAIREGFLELIRDGSLRARLIAAGRENCRSFTLEAVAAQYRSLYRELNQ